MEQTALELASTQGLYAVLFVGLLFYVLKENSKREIKYQELIKELSDNLKIKLSHIEDRLDDIFTKK